jgi:hypothetical protein
MKNPKDNEAAEKAAQAFNTAAQAAQAALKPGPTVH